MSEDKIKSKIMNKWEEIKNPNDKAFDMNKFQNYLIRSAIDTSIEESQKLADQIQTNLEKLKPN